jgi:hypothetical protein
MREEHFTLLLSSQNCGFFVFFRPTGSPPAAFQAVMDTTKVSAPKKPPCGGATSDANLRRW